MAEASDLTAGAAITPHGSGEPAVWWSGHPRRPAVLLRLTSHLSHCHLFRYASSIKVAVYTKQRMYRTYGGKPYALLAVEDV